jgi:hypothetical protein
MTVLLLMIGTKMILFPLCCNQQQVVLPSFLATTEAPLCISDNILLSSYCVMKEEEKGKTNKQKIGCPAINSHFASTNV